MTKRMRIVVVAAAFGVLGAIGAQAADSVAVKANVPFDFVVANKHVPAGEYWFAQQPSGLMRISSDKLKEPIVTACVPAQDEPSGPGELVFVRYGSEHYLQSIDAATAHFAAVFPKSHAEQEWATRLRVAAMVRIALK